MWALLLGVGLASAGDAEPRQIRAPFANGDGGVSTWGHLREILSRHPDFAVDALGNRVGQDVSLDQRLRVGLGLDYLGLNVATEWDLFTGLAAGDTWDIPGGVDARLRDRYAAWSLEGFVPRRASVSARIPSAGVLIEGGLMPANTWGLGILANGGEEEDLWGRTDRGDRMIRARLSFAPFRRDKQILPLFFTVAFDQVVEDDTARLSAGENANHVIASVLWNDPDGRKAGFFYTFRTQEEPGDAPRPTLVHALDLYADVPIPLGNDWTMRLAAEGALLVGSTERVLTYADLTSTDILSGGVAGEIDFRSPKDWFGVHLRTGFASATGDPDAGTLQDFTFDSNYNVGLILFDEVMGSIEAGAYARIDDPADSGGAPPGADLLVTEGSARRVAYLWPTFTTHPTDWFDVQLGVLAAWSTGPVSHPFYTTRAGGEPRNHLDQPTGDDRYLGTEFELALGLGRGPRTKDWLFRPSLWLQGAVLVPGEVLGMEPQSLFLATGRVDF